jgi:uncharacterized membrane protein
MDDNLVSLIAASIAFVGSHFVMSHPLRAGLVRMLGAAGFQIGYSLVSFATLGWMIFGFRAIGAGAPGLWDGSGDGVWALASVLTLLAGVLFVGSLLGNPALPMPGAMAAAQKPVHGVFLVTRHPMMWSFALWALAHVLVSSTPRSLILCGAVAFLALVGSHLQDRKKTTLAGEAWEGWEAKTSFWPKPGGLARAGAIPWLGGIGLWLAATWAHIPALMLPAGVWRWLVA